MMAVGNTVVNPNNSRAAIQKMVAAPDRRPYRPPGPPAGRPSSRARDPHRNQGQTHG